MISNLLRGLALSLTLGSAALGQSVGDSIFPSLGQRGLDVQHYDLHLTVPRPGEPHLSGDVTLTVGAREPLSRIVLDLLGPRVSAAQWNGQRVRWVQTAQKVEVTLPRPLRPGETGRLRLLYAGTPELSGDPGLPIRPGWQNEAGLSYSLSEPHGTRGFLPCNDHPSDPATFTVRVTVPASASAAASGLFTTQTERNGLKTLTFTQRVPVPTYALGLIVGPLERRTAPDVQLGAQTVHRRDIYAAGLPAGTTVPEGETARMLRVLSDWFGPYPDEVYGVALLPVRQLALETAGLTTMPATSNRERVRLHELAHQWFGDQVTLADWADTWLSEGFATYAELLWAESQGEDGQAMAADWYARLSVLPSRPLRATREEEIFDASAYFRGALALHALRLKVGDAAFGQFLHSYVKTFTGRPVSTTALLTLVKTQLGAEAEQTLRVWVEGRTLPPLPEPVGAPV